MRLEFIQGLIGSGVFLLLALALSEDKKSVSWGKISRLMLSHVLLLWCFLKFPLCQRGLLFLGKGVQVLRESVLKGTGFVFGYLGGDTAPFVLAEGKGSLFIFMFQALPMIVVLSALSMLFFHWRILPFFVTHLSKVTQRLWNIGGALGTVMAAKLFLGQTDAPFLIRPYLNSLTRNELFSMMTAGMATASSTLFVLFTLLLEKSLGSQAIVHVLTSAVINIPSALIMSELMMPERASKTEGTYVAPHTFINSMEALTKGTLDGWKIMGIVAAMVLVSLSLVALVNAALSSLCVCLTGCAFSIEQGLGLFFWPWIWCMGIPKEEVFTAGGILATKTLLNELAALIPLAKACTLSKRSISILSYSLCSFGNLSSIAIQVGALGGLIPERKSELARLAPRALVAGTLAGWFSGAIVSLFI